jgi:predicted hotdog family 3-hydroxylacyl-ACP dehydratase
MLPETDILPLIPQRAPFVMIDTLTACDEQGASTEFTVKPGNLFVQDNQLREPALVENIAQTAAARMGYICRTENKPVPVGFIGAVQNLVVKALPVTGEVLHTTILIKNQVFNATVISGEIKTGDKTLATCEMKIFTS